MKYKPFQENNEENKTMKYGQFQAWEMIVARYAKGRPLCNCHMAYYEMTGEGTNVRGDKLTNLPVCRYGCQANLYSTKLKLAELIIDELQELDRIKNENRK